MRHTTERTGTRFSGGCGPGPRWFYPAVLIATLALWQHPVEAEVHPFYREALSAGVAAHDRGDYAVAAERFRVAGFGLLEEPLLLTESLARLGLAQAAAGRRDEFQGTFDRISQMEERLGAYSASHMPESLRLRFEEQVALLVPPATLEQSMAFAKLYRQQETLRVKNMLPGARVAALEQIVAKNPGDLGWQLMLATARIESGSGADAIAALEGMRADRPEDSRIACLLGRGYLQAGRCDAVLQAPSETLHKCDVRRLPTVELVRHLECLSDVEQWPEAATIITSLPPERRAARPFPNWEKRVSKKLQPDAIVEMLPPYVAGQEVPADEPRTTSTRVPAGDVEATLPAGGQPGGSGPAVSRTALTNLRKQLDGARTVNELQDLAKAAVDLQRQYPESGSEALDIAGEAAYRASQWQLASEYLQASGGPPDDRFDLLFYLSVSLYESGDLAGARQSLIRALPGLEKTPLVERYRKEILGTTR